MTWLEGLSCPKRDVLFKDIAGVLRQKPSNVGLWHICSGEGATETHDDVDRKFHHPTLDWSLIIT